MSCSPVLTTPDSNNFEFIESVEWGLPRNDPGYDTDQSLAPQPRRERRQEVCGCPPGSACLDDSCVFFACQEECRSQCHASCQNRRLTDANFKKVQIFDAEQKGQGLRLLEAVKKGEILLEYVGRAVPQKSLAKYFRRYRLDRRLYIMSLGDNVYLDARERGNVARFINHSCEPNCQVQRWKVRGVLRAAVVATRDMEPQTELTFDYQWERQQGRALTKCYCGAPSCRGTLEIDVEQHSAGEVGGGDGSDDEYEGEWKPATLCDQSLVNRVVKVREGNQWRIAEVVGYRATPEVRHQLLFRDDLEESWVDMTVAQEWKLLEEPEEDFMIAKKMKPGGTTSSTPTSTQPASSMLDTTPRPNAPVVRNFLYVQTPVKQAFWAKHLVERVERSCQVIISAQQMSRPPLAPQTPEDFEMHKALDQSYDGTVWRIGITGTDIPKAYTILAKNVFKNIPAPVVPVAVTTGVAPSPNFQTELIYPRTIADMVKPRLSKVKCLTTIPSDSKCKAFSRVSIQSNTQVELEQATASVWATLLEASNTAQVKMTPQGYPCSMGMLAGTLSPGQLDLLLYGKPEDRQSNGDVISSVDRLTNPSLRQEANIDLSCSTFFKTFQSTYKCSVWVQSEEDKGRVTSNMTVSFDSSRKVFLSCQNLADVPMRWTQIMGRARDLERGIRYLCLGRDRVFQQLMMMTPAFFDFLRNTTGSTVEIDPVTGEHLKIDGVCADEFALPREIQGLSAQDRASVAEEIIRLQVELYRDHYIIQRNGLFGRDWTLVDTSEKSSAPASVGALDSNSACTCAVEIASIVAELELQEAVGGHAATILYRFVSCVGSSSLKAREVVMACIYLANKCQKTSKTKKLEKVLEAGYKIFYPGTSIDFDSDEGQVLAERVIAAETEVLNVLEYDIFFSDIDWLVDTITAIPKLNADFARQVSSFAFSGQVLGAGAEIWLKYGQEYVFAVAAAFLKTPLNKLLSEISLNPMKLCQAAELLAERARYGKRASKAAPSNPLLESRSGHLAKYLPSIKEKCTNILKDRLSSNAAITQFSDECAPLPCQEIARRVGVRAVVRGVPRSVCVGQASFLRNVIPATSCDVKLDTGSSTDTCDILLIGEWRAISQAFSAIRANVAGVPDLEYLEDAAQAPLRQGKMAPGKLNTADVETAGGWRSTLQPDSLLKDGLGGKSCVCGTISKAVLVQNSLRWWVPQVSARNSSALLLDHFDVRSSENGAIDGVCALATALVAENKDEFPWLTGRLTGAGTSNESDEVEQVPVSLQRWPSEKAGRREVERSKRAKVDHVGFSAAALQELQLLTQLHRMVPSPGGHPNFLQPVAIAAPVDREEDTDVVRKVTPMEEQSFSLFKSSEENEKLAASEKTVRCHPHMVFCPTPFVLQRFLSRKHRPHDGHPIGPKLVLSWFHDLVSAFLHCHSSHVILRQLHPDQILVDRSGVIKLSGLYRSTILNPSDRKKSPNPVKAARSARKQGSKKKKEGDDFSNNVYAAPEILMGSPVYSKESDVWMLGCLLAQILLGKPLFVGKERSVLLHAQFKVVGNVSSSNYDEARGFPYYKKPEKKYKWGVDKALGHLLKDRSEEFSKAVDLISKMLHLDPKERCSVKEAMGHDFFADYVTKSHQSDFQEAHIREWESLKGNTVVPPGGQVFNRRERERDKKRKAMLMSSVDQEDDLYDMGDLLGEGSPKKKLVV